jgi:hypothetical protein
LRAGCTGLLSVVPVGDWFIGVPNITALLKAS